MEGITVERLGTGAEPAVDPDAIQVGPVMSAEPAQVAAPACVPDAPADVLRQHGLGAERDYHEEKRGCDRGEAYNPPERA